MTKKLFVKSLAVTTVLVFFSFAVMSISIANASTIGITSVSALGTTDTFDWGQLGTGNILPPATVTSTAGGTATLSYPGTNAVVLEQGFGWLGNFSPGTLVLYSFNEAPLTFSLTNPVAGIGAQIQSNAAGNFTAEIMAYDASNDLLGSFSENGIATFPGHGTAPFLGITDTSADIAKVVFSLTANENGSLTDFAIGPVETSVSETPLPATLPMFGFALLGLAVYGAKQRKTSGS